MIESVVTIVAGVIAIVLVILQRNTKTKLDKAREVVDRSRSRAAKMRLLLEERNIVGLEEELDRQDRDLAAVLGLSRKTRPADGGKNS